MVTELLAGELEFEKFDADHKQMNNDNRNMIKEFFLIHNISVEECHSEDDDWITFKYGSGSAAISKYK